MSGENDSLTTKPTMLAGRPAGIRCELVGLEATPSGQKPRVSGFPGSLRQALVIYYRYQDVL